jgi:hypothetical protein
MSDNLPAVREAPSTTHVSVWESPASFEAAQRMAGCLVKSTMVPESYRDNLPNAIIALDVAQRTNSSPLMVMQNLHIIEGRPTWASQFVIAALNSCGRFTPLKFKITDLGDKVAEYERWTGAKGERKREVVKANIHDYRCVAYATDRATGEVLEGPDVSISMAVAEGWYTKPGSKWRTMESLMLRYRAAKFFGNLYAPDILMGMQSADERADIIEGEFSVVEQPAAKAAEAAPATGENKRSRPRGVAAAMKAAEAQPQPHTEVIDVPTNEPEQAAYDDDVI